ncbi:MAG: glycosyltransferase family 39 protein [Anaerolineales bacterium]
MTTATIPSKSSFLSHKLVLGITPAHLFVAAIMLLSAILHFSNLEAIGDANTYYTAAAEAMTQSWHNFFFVAAEPGGSVTVDKPPLGLWIEAAFAFVLGVEGWVVSLPNILAGIFSVPLLYHLVKKYLGEIAGLVAALTLVVTPVAIATDRNNTMDGMLVFTLLLAAWAFVAATETGKSRWLFLGAFIVGLGFNIKMLQAFLPLPAFYALYFFGAETGWWKKIVSIGVSGIILLVVSLSWAVAVDLTPADQRPYIGSSDNNTVMELIIGHNGLSRLLGRGGGKAPQNAVAPDGGAPNLPPQPNDGNGQPPAQRQAPPQALEACENLSPGDACSFTLRDGNTIQGTCITPPNTSDLACAPQTRQPQIGQPQQGNRPATPPGALGDGPNASPNNPNNTSTPFSNETGSPGAARFFVSPLSKQMSWLLPFALASLILLAFAASIRIPLDGAHKALVLWGGWLLTCVVFFSMVEGIFHAYYTIMLAPALGAVVGAGFAQLWRWQVKGRGADALLLILAGMTLAFQVYTATQYGVAAWWVYIPILFLLFAVALMFISRRAGYLVTLAAMLVIPLIWTGMTVFDIAPEVNLPSAFSGGNAPQAAPGPAPVPQANAGLNERNKVDDALVAYLQANTQDTYYMVAASSSQVGSPLVIATGRPVLYMGGFSGGDPVIDADGLAELVANGALRYVLLGGRNNKQDITQWLDAACTVVPEFSQVNNRSPQDQPRPDGRNNAERVLYRCEP